ncbi:coiled-coil domain-containing protein 169 isoform X2 [Rhinatrema bivittatum]|uniref:coiled-coil domain-containing protein 169 isoform X2 n=1 Tax=Rhinatrema bivittatum TaxID=194408 RepID=UPI00112AB9DB|nr:coiled-coil domain-containing protein 169 isoform X2 [Rhinatrema bivittatum]
MGEGAEDFSALPTDRLRTELEQEQQMKEMLELSISEMRSTVTELEKRLGSVEDERNEWKTRYETQMELNRQLERHIGLLQEKVEHMRGDPADRLSSVRAYDQMPVGALNQLIKQLEAEKMSVQNQLKDYELRMEQESKAYHKANDERRTYLAEISEISAALEAKRQQADPVHGSRENQILKGIYNIPANQRILDPKKGPIKKTAAVKHLPKLKH